MMGAALENSAALFFLKGNRKNMSTRGKKGWILAFSLPCLVLFCLVYAIPFVMVITTSFCDYSLTQSPVFEGLKNFKTIFADPDFSVSIVNTLKWVLIQSTLHVGFGFVMALSYVENQRDGNLQELHMLFLTLSRQQQQQ